MNIGEAVSALKEGKKVTRTKGWHGKHFLMYVWPDDPVFVFDNGECFEASDPETAGDQPFRSLNPFVGIVAANDPGGVTPWLCSQADLLADDWDIFTDQEKE